MITRAIEYFSLEHTALSGQCFRMNPIPGGGFSVISQGRFLEIFQKENIFSFSCSEEDFPYWENYFDLKTDYRKIASSVLPQDSYLRKAAEFGKGIRILRQDVWEMIITFVISQQKTIPKIKEAAELLSCSYGKQMEAFGHVYYAFPTPAELSKASLEDLLKLKLGYRAKYIHRICRDALEGHLDLNFLAAMDYAQAMDYLTGFYGIGEKVANCICLFGLHHVDAFPVDTWIKKILLREYYSEKYNSLPKSKLYDAIIKEHFSIYKGYAGVMQQYIFFYERSLSQTTGSLPECSPDS